jgi:protein-S-isoprenylcysteine O-methyltransferase Ste14
MKPGEPSLGADAATRGTSGNADRQPSPVGKSDAQPESRKPSRVLRVAANIVGASGAVLFARAGLQHYLHTHSFVGALFFAEQLWIVVAFLVRRPARHVSQRLSDWLLAFGGTFGGVLFRPDGAHSHWGIIIGLGLQLAGLAVCVSSFFALGRSFGFAPADRGLRRRGPYSVVRHPIYASYFLLQLGYVLQSISVRNALVMVFVCSCNIGRALAEERFLSTSTDYNDYRAAVPWRLAPGVW